MKLLVYLLVIALSIEGFSSLDGGRSSHDDDDDDDDCKENDCKIVNGNDHGEYEYECGSSKCFPTIKDDAVTVKVTGGCFDEIPFNTFHEEKLEEITIESCHIETIKEKAFSGLNRIRFIKFDDVTVDEIEGEAFFKLSAPDQTILNDQPSRLSFNKMTVNDKIADEAFYDINFFSLIEFNSVTIKSADDVFKDVEIKTGGDFTVNDGVVLDGDFSDISDVRGKFNVRISSFVQETLSLDLIPEDVDIHMIHSSEFDDLDEDLCETKHSDTRFDWYDVRIYCGEDIDWLMEDKKKIPEGMLEGLICHGPESLTGQNVENLEYDDWLNASQSDSLPAIVIIAIIIGGLLFIVLVIALIVYCCRKTRPTPVVSPTSAPPIVIVDKEKKCNPDDDSPPPYDDVKGSSFAHQYDNPAGPPYDNPKSTLSPQYDNPSNGNVPYDNHAGVHGGPVEAQGYNNHGMNIPEVVNPQAPPYESIYDEPTSNTIVPSAPKE